MRRGVWAVTLLGLAMRLYAGWRWNVTRPTVASRLLGDAPGYDALAKEILAGRGVSWPGRVPLYPLWLAAMHALSGGSYDAIVYAQALLGTVVVPLTYSLAGRIFGHAAGLLAGLGAALSFVLVRQSLNLLSEVLFTPVVLIAAITLWDAVREPSARRFAWAGVWVGVSDLVRPTLLFFPLFVAAALVIQLGARRALRYGAVYALAAALVITPWIVRNWVRYRAVLPLATSNAILWQGSPEYYHLTHDRGYTYLRVWQEVLYPHDSEAPYPGTVEGERYWRDRALRSIRREPGVYLRYAAEKLGTYWVGDHDADWGDTYVFNFRALRRLGFTRSETAQLMLARLLPIVALAAALVLRRRWRALLPIYALLAYCTLLHAATHAEARLSEPLQPFLLILVAGAVTAVLLGGSAPGRDEPSRTAAISERCAPARPRT